MNEEKPKLHWNALRTHTDVANYAYQEVGAILEGDGYPEVHAGNLEVAREKLDKIIEALPEDRRFPHIDSLRINMTIAIRAFRKQHPMHP